jgi:transcriptional regulator with XRE-family HTH domain
MIGAFMQTLQRMLEKKNLADVARDAGCQYASLWRIANGQAHDIKLSLTWNLMAALGVRLSDVLRQYEEDGLAQRAPDEMVQVIMSRDLWAQIRHHKDFDRIETIIVKH